MADNIYSKIITTKQIIIFEILRRIYVVVHLAENKNDHKLYACKIYHFPESFDDSDQTHIMNESVILLTLDYPCIFKIEGLNFKSVNSRYYKHHVANKMDFIEEGNV